jgi:hypothetical protein
MDKTRRRPHSGRVPRRTPAAALAVTAVVVALTASVPAAGALPAERQVDRQATGGAHLSGTIVFEQAARPGYPAGAGATWSVDGDALYLLQEAPLLGITDTTGWSNSDEKYAHATLTGYHVPVQVFPCGDGTDATTTVGYPAIAGANAAVGITGIHVDQLTGKGSIQVNLAESPTRDDELLAAGTVLDHTHSDCYGTSTDTTAPVPVMGVRPAPLSSWWPLNEGRVHEWKMLRNAAGDWVVNADKHFGTQSYDQASETVHLTLHGSLPSLRANCVLPSVRRLRPLTSFRQADALTTKAGFSRFVHQSKPSRAAPRGHFFITEGIGNKYAECGQHHLHIVRSLGWPRTAPPVDQRRHSNRVGASALVRRVRLAM